jgi:hypothetical protein
MLLRREGKPLNRVPFLVSGSSSPAWILSLIHGFWFGHLHRDDDVDYALIDEACDWCCKLLNTIGWISEHILVCPSKTVALCLLHPTTSCLSFFCKQEVGEYSHGQICWREDMGGPDMCFCEEKLSRVSPRVSLRPSNAASGWAVVLACGRMYTVVMIMD